MKIKEKIDKSIFRQYDIRGDAIEIIDDDTAYTIGLAFGTKLLALGKKYCVVGHDNRLSGEHLTNSLLEGILSTGINVKYLGLVTTPMYYFACINLGIDSGVMVTASHNPTNDNGFKIAFKNYDNACGQDIEDFYELCSKKVFAYGNGNIENIDIRKNYIERILKDLNINKKLKVVIDPANATGSIIVKDIFDKILDKPIYINNYSDGSFPSHHPDPSVKENMVQLQDAVIKNGADIGIALDGDADRVGIIDEKGNIVSIDTYMGIIWNDIMPTAKSKTALFDVKCSKQLEDEIIRLGGTPYIYRTGNSYQKNKIKEMDLDFGGELSGHVFFRDKWDGFDDGIYAGLRLLEIMTKKETSVSNLYSNFNLYYSTPEIKIRVREDNKFKIVDMVKDYVKNESCTLITIDGARINYEDGWALVRASNTGPDLTTRFEAKTKERCEELEKKFLNYIETIKNI